MHVIDNKGISEIDFIDIVLPCNISYISHRHVI